MCGLLCGLRVAFLVVCHVLGVWDWLRGWVQGSTRQLARGWLGFKSRFIEAMIDIITTRGSKQRNQVQHARDNNKLERARASKQATVGGSKTGATPHKFRAT